MEPYALSDVKNQMAHITNSCVQRTHPQFSEDFTVRLLSELNDEIGKDKVDLIFQKMIINLAEIFKAVHKEFSGFFPLPNCFELYGVDFLIDENCNPIILEFNCGPDMKNTGSRLDHVISSLLEDTLNVAVDSYFTPEKKIDKGRLHLVYCDESNQWGSPNMSFN